MARPLRKTYSPTHPYVIERVDHDDGDITYEIWDTRPESYRLVCHVSEPGVGGEDDEEYPESTRGRAHTDAEMIVRALNLMNGGLPEKGRA